VTVHAGRDAVPSIPTRASIFLNPGAVTVHAAAGLVCHRFRPLLSLLTLIRRFIILINNA